MKSKKNSLKKESWNKHDPIKIIGSENFRKEILEEEKPTLLMCMGRVYGFYEQINVVKSISRINNNIFKVCILEEKFIKAFMKKFKVGGTPTFFIFNKGKENGRMLGRKDKESLTVFLLQTLSSFI